MCSVLSCPSDFEIIISTLIVIGSMAVCVWFVINLVLFDYV